MIENTISRFAQLADITQNEALNRVDLIRDAYSEVMAKVRSGAENDSRAEFAAAALALYRYRVATAGNSSVESFTAGDISVKMTKVSAAEALEFYNLCMKDARDILIDDEFVFMNTKES
ncbi:MAG: hypothetical protein IIY78_04200 [Clostridia bacterium]|nr:hypothetical protein [Clostridia bacterium]